MIVSDLICVQMLGEPELGIWDCKHLYMSMNVCCKQHFRVVCISKFNIVVILDFVLMEWCHFELPFGFDFAKEGLCKAWYWILRYLGTCVEFNFSVFLFNVMFGRCDNYILIYRKCKNVGFSFTHYPFTHFVQK